MVKNVYMPSAPALAVSAQSNLSEQHKTLLGRVDHLFSKRNPLLTLWQDIAENFWPEMADFTYKRSLSDDFAANLSTSYPLLVRRELGNAISAMLRPPGQIWAHIATDRPEDTLDNASQRWLEAKTKVLHRAMSDPVAKFKRATSEADHCFATFGQAVLSVEVNPYDTALLYRSWHLRDVVWCEKFDGSIGLIGRKWKPTAYDLVRIFGEGAVHPKVMQLVGANNGKGAYQEVECRHIMVPSEEYGAVSNTPYVSIYIDVENKFVMREESSITSYYVIPRWETLPGFQYAYSPAIVAGLPDARLLQSITFTLLKAGEKAVDPPMIATEQMVKSPIDIMPGGVTWIDGEYDERYGEVLRPMTVDSRSLPVGLNMQDRLEQLLRSAFYLDKMQLPPMMPDTTAFEIAQRIQEYIRQALPLFQPIEDEYNAKLCQNTFDLLLANNAFGPAEQIPEMLQGRDVRFRFESPLIEASDQKLVQTFMTTRNLLEQVAAVDPAAVQMVDAQVALRDTLRGGGVPAKWVKGEDEMAAITAQEQKKREMMEQMQMIQQGGVAGQAAGQAGQAIAGAAKQAKEATE